MPLSNRTLLVIALLLLAIRLYAQTDPSGHWEGAISAPLGEAAIEVDLAKNAQGQLIGTFDSVGENLKGLPLSNLSVNDREAIFELKASSGDGTFTGRILDDGKSIAGTVGSFTFALTRTGEAHFEAPPKSAPISRELEGVWKGVIDLSPEQLHIALRMSNQADGTSTGTITSVDKGFDVPVAIVQKGEALSLSVKALNSSWSGALNSAATELTGTYKTGQGAELPLTFHRSAGN